MHICYTDNFQVWFTTVYNKFWSSYNTDMNSNKNVFTTYLTVNGGSFLCTVSYQLTYLLYILWQK